MDGSRPVPAGRIWWWLGGAAVVVIVIAWVAVASGAGRSPSSPAGPSPSASAASPSPASASPAVTPSLTPTPTPSATPSPVATRAVRKEAYCRAYAEIRTTSVSPDSEDGGVDYEELADLFTTLIRSYSAAAKAAPSSLDRQYAVVLGYLADMREAVVSKDLDGIKLMVTNLELLNQSMVSIQQESEQICR